MPAVVIAASGGDDPRALADKLESAVLPELKAVEGIRTVDLTGTRDELLVITPDPAKLAAARLQPTAIGTALQTNGVTLPAGARLTVDDTPTQSTTAQRTFVWPPLERGKTFSYTLKAEVYRNGQPVAQTRQVTVRAGEQTNVHFDFAPVSVAQR